MLDDYRTLNVHGAAVKGWAASGQDKGLLEELRMFAHYLHGKIGAPITLDELASTTAVSVMASKANEALTI